MSDEKLDLDARYFAGDTTPDDMRAVGDQFIGMMSKMIGMMVGLAVFIFLLFMYLLTKAVIDHSARSISYMKVFGYRDGEISHLYIRSITLCVVASLVLSLPVIIGSLTAIFRSMLLAYNGNIEIYVPTWSMAACVGIGFATYLVVALLHTRYQARQPGRSPQGAGVVIGDVLKRLVVGDSLCRIAGSPAGLARTVPGGTHLSLSPMSGFTHLSLSPMSA